MKRNLSVFSAVVCLITAVTLFAQQKTWPGQLGIDVSGMDRSVRPQDDFFRYVNGAWADKTEIPPRQVEIRFVRDAWRRE